MSQSEARRQIELAHKIIEDDSFWQYNGTEVSLRSIGSITLLGFAALVEAIAENKPYDGTLNSIRVPFPTLRGIILDAEKAGSEDIGLEDLIITLRARVRNSDID